MKAFDSLKSNPMRRSAVILGLVGLAFAFAIFANVL